ncbi:hypothetical protein Clacol_004011 [Clathrus columnatus]|uniref:Glucose-methanol-choline oxidoreductase N-terminal domain-containing protein n=1 Tax=Clathrus columnatus TaxID=1419009 RepID=A0AAV5A808_9AGAM|nr:hypothetical protein Clacol_004011 [Clathrus columnatus]
MSMSTWIPAALSPNILIPCVLTLSVLLLLYSKAKPSRKSLFCNPDLVAERVNDAKKDTHAENVSFEHDIVIAGGGTAGCVLASRLSEDPKLRVLLIEAGVSSQELLMSRMPVGFAQLLNSKHDFSIMTEPQIYADNVKRFWPRAKLLGGCSAINAMMFHAGAPSDYDEWAKTGLDGAAGWSYQALRKYFLKFEKYNPHPLYPGVDLKERGSDGLVNVGYFGYCSQATTKLIKACINLDIPHNPDVNSPSRGTLGVTKRPNLKVVLNSTVTSIIFDESNGKKRAVGVEFAQRDPETSVNTFYRVKVKKEVVLSAGAIHSPHILLLSGVGPKQDLKKHGIPVVHDLPGVGQTLQDHAAVQIRLALKPGHSLQYLGGDGIINQIFGIIALLRWTWFGTGPMTTNTGESAAFVRADNTKLFEPDSYKIEDETSGSDAPDIETLMIPTGFVRHGLDRVVEHPSMTMTAIALRPQSRGIVALKSSNPFDLPLVDPKYLEKSNDLAVLVRGLKLLIKLGNTEPMFSALQKTEHPYLDHDLGKASDAQLEKEVKKRVETLYHPTSTCRMARLEDGGVVDAQLKVYGLENVRVADASIFPRIPAGHTAAPALAVGEKAADIIKQSLASQKNI